MGWNNFVPLLVLCLSGSLAATSNVQCEGDDGCSSDEYCGASRCIECFDCSMLNRHANTTCAKTLDDCGACLLGYEEVALTLFSDKYKKPCKKRNKAEAETIGRGNCSLDQECGAGQFCYEHRLCIFCLDCTVYQRRSSATDSCAKSVYDCGPCLPGFLDVPVTDGSRPKPCQGLSSPLLSQKTEVNLNVGALSLLGGVSVVGLAILCAIVAYRARNAKTVSPSVESPPPYPEGGEVERGEVERAEQVCGFYKEHNEADCTARVFQLPNYVSPSRPPPRTANGDTVDATLDEDTMPCAWRPCRDEGEGGSENALTFSGQLTCLVTPAVSETTSLFEEEPVSEPIAKRRK